MDVPNQLRRQTVLLTVILLVVVGLALVSSLGYLELVPESTDHFDVPEPAPGPALGPTPRISSLGLHEVTGSFPDTPLGTHGAWAVEQLNLQGLALTEETIRAHMAPSVLEDTTASFVVAELNQLSGRNAPYAFVGFLEANTATEMKAVLMTRWGTLQVLNLATEATEPYLLTTLWFSNWEADPPAPR